MFTVWGRPAASYRSNCRSQANVMPYSDFLLCTSRSAKCLYAKAVSFPVLPYADKTSGVKIAYPTSLTWSPYTSFSLQCHTVDRKQVYWCSGSPESSTHLEIPFCSNWSLGLEVIMQMFCCRANLLQWNVILWFAKRLVFWRAWYSSLALVTGSITFRPS